MSLLADRRRFLAFFSSLGLSTTLLPGTLWAMAQQEPAVTSGMLNAALKLADLSLEEPQRQLMLQGLNDQREAARAIRALALPISLAPAVHFDPVLLGITTWDAVKRPVRLSPARAPAVGKDLETLAFTPVRDLAELLRTRQVSSVALTEMFLGRLERLDAKSLSPGSARSPGRRRRTRRSRRGSTGGLCMACPGAPRICCP